MIKHNECGPRLFTQWALGWPEAWALGLASNKGVGVIGRTVGSRSNAPIGLGTLMPYIYNFYFFLTSGGLLLFGGFRRLHQLHHLLSRSCPSPLTNIFFFFFFFFLFYYHFHLLTLTFFFFTFLFYSRDYMLYFSALILNH